MRRFVALPVPDEPRAALDAAVASLRARSPRWRWTDPAGWHVTLAFLGEVDDDAAGEAVEVVRTAVAAGIVPLTLRFGAAGRFGSRVLWAGLDDDPAGSVAALGARVQTGLEAAGLPVDRKPVRPHLTLARARSEAPITSEAPAMLSLPDVAWVCRRAELWVSHLDDGPARYTVDASIPLLG